MVLLKKKVQKVLLLYFVNEMKCDVLFLFVSDSDVMMVGGPGREQYGREIKDESNQSGDVSFIL